MKPTRVILFLLGTVLADVSAFAGDLRLSFVPQFHNVPLVFDSLTNTTAAGQTISVTRLDFLLSGFALRRADGVWVEQKNWYAFVSARAGKTAFTLPNFPAAQYDRARFHIGLPLAVNRTDPAQLPADHPLNPGVNHLHWGWSGGYIFLALEGAWQAEGRPSGYSYHLATDHQLMTIELPAALNLSTSRELRLNLDVAKIFAAPNEIRLTDSTATTHSRTNDPFASLVRQNVEAAFGVEGVHDFTPPLVAILQQPAPKPLIAASATPYRLTISQFFPQPNLPRDNPLTGEGVSLGSQLFFDRRLSDGNFQSCAACHHPREAFSERRRVSRGFAGAFGERNAMPLLNLAWKDSFFWDGRAATLREQVLQPIQNPVEMHESLDDAVAKIAADPNYPRLFAAAFGTPEVTADRLARALEQFLLSQTSFDSKFDRVIAGRAKFTDTEQRGFDLFNTEYDPYHGQRGADCFHCHGGPLFRSQNFANNGLTIRPADLGRFRVTKLNGDQGKFAVPSLRNVEITGPYMHDGRFFSLEQVVEHYNSGVRRTTTLDPNLAKHPATGLQLSPADKAALVAFLRTLTDEKFHAPATTPVP